MDYNSNYLIIDEYNDTYNKKNNYVKKRTDKKKYIVIIVIVIAVLLSVFFAISKNSYQSVEKQLVIRAKQYVDENNLVINKNYYLDVKTLNFPIKETCSEVSGVIILSNETFYPYLQCDDYESKINQNDDAIITLYGNNVVFLSSNEKYAEAGYKSDYQVNVINKIGSVKGIYQVTYEALNNHEVVGKAQRLVIIKDSIEENLYPNISLLGDDIVYLNKGDIYEEKGVVAFDSKDGNITNKISVSNSLNVDAAGEYKIIYKVVNSLGYEATVTRKIVVIDEKVEEIVVNYYVTPVNIINTPKTIVMNISSKSYDYVILPNGEKSRESLIKYEVSENGNYTFKIYDTKGNEKLETIKVDYIDTTKPILSCSAIITNNGIDIIAVSNDNYGISSYRYIVDGVETGEMIENNYHSFSKKATAISSKVKDLVGNETSATCSIEDKRIPASNYCMDNIIYEGTRYTLTESQREKLAAMVQSEYGSDIVGMKMVASHMANLYEYMKWRGKTSESFYGYISSTTWYAGGTRSNKNYSQDAMSAVIECVVEGHRTLPLYINEFDWYPHDVVNPKKIEEYVIDESEIHNKYGAVGKFWCVSQNESKSDANIFFYTNEKYKDLVDN